MEKASKRWGRSVEAGACPGSARIGVLPSHSMLTALLTTAPNSAQPTDAAAYVSHPCSQRARQTGKEAHSALTAALLVTERHRSTRPTELGAGQGALNNQAHLDPICCPYIPPHASRSLPLHPSPKISKGALIIARSQPSGAFWTARLFPSPVPLALRESPETDRQRGTDHSALAAGQSVAALLVAAIQGAGAGAQVDHEGQLVLRAQHRHGLTLVVEAGALAAACTLGRQVWSEVKVAGRAAALKWS